MAMSEDQLKEKIRTCGLTQGEIYRETGVHAPSISRFMRGLAGLSHRSAYKLEVFFQARARAASRAAKAASVAQVADGA